MRTILGLFLFLVFGNAFVERAQGQITFQKIFHCGGCLSEGYSIEQTTDHGYIVGGHGNDFYLIKTDSIGNTLWNRNIDAGANEGLYSVRQTFDNGYIIIGFTNSFGAGYYDIYLVKVDSGGNVEWSKTYGGNNYEVGLSVRQTTDSGYIVVGNTQSFGNKVYLIKTDRNGNIQWSKVYGGAGTDEGHDVQQTQDSGFVILGRSTSFGGLLSFLIRTDRYGNVVWSRTFGEGNNNLHLFEEKNGDIVIGEGGPDMYLYKIDSAGNLIWSRNYSASDPTSLLNINRSSDGGSILIGIRESSSIIGMYYINLIKVNESGFVDWSKLFGGYSVYKTTTHGNNAGYGVAPTFDNGYIISGSTDYVDSTLAIYLIKTDSLGNSGCNDSTTQTISTLSSAPFNTVSTTVSTPATLSSSLATITTSGGTFKNICLSMTGIDERDIYYISIYPNPSSGNFTISFKENLHNVSVRIFNVMGEEVSHVVVGSGTGSKQEINVRLGTSVAGIYFVQVVDRKKIYTEKLIVQ